nr:immunoglobulin heavy chain junction region [Macaca mulatta]MOX91741.1 immunoglobulin heavy chain junction region [Macaca mulatta]MOX91809.1 immunoglobulin heavy chain junction region [Macaca mulatta]MOX92086.1 immunoglobulin heavy chain junction region [Macaca mulatta]MOX92113.1 immunoglobulin heavy chain junction region [Macaca mulatta]
CVKDAYGSGFDSW